MPVYRAYIVNSNRFSRAEVLDCACDEKAMELASAFLSQGEAVEIWERARFVTTLSNTERLAS